MENLLGRHYTFKPLLKYALPSMLMMICMSAYTMVDGIMVARFVNTDALAAVNILFPITNIVVAVAIMFATGGSAVIARYMGEGKKKEGNGIFTALLVVLLVFGILISVFGQIFTTEIVRFLGADDRVLPYCVDYAKMILWFPPMACMQMLFEFMFTVAGKPSISLVLTVAAGVTNLVLDYVFLSFTAMGVKGAALASGIGFSIPAVVGLFYFAFKRKGTLYLGAPKAGLKTLGKIMLNGSSEMVTNMSMAVVTLMFNLMMMRYLGADGVSAITIVLYVQFFLNSVFMGYSSGIAPIISYKFGAHDAQQQKTIFKTSLIFVTSVSVSVFVLSEILSPYFVLIFADKASEVYNIASTGGLIFAVCYLFSGFNIFASSYFTALNNGVVSSVIAVSRSLLFPLICFFLLPPFIGVTGIWLAVPIAEFAGLIVTVVFLVFNRKKYGYALDRTVFVSAPEYIRK